jgi:hypothetical protein
VPHLRAGFIVDKVGHRATRDPFSFLVLTNFFFIFRPKIACQVPKPPNSLKPNKIEFEI